MNELNQLRGQDEGNIPLVIVRDQVSKESSGLLFLVISQKCWFNQIQLITPSGLGLGVGPEFAHIGPVPASRGLIELNLFQGQGEGSNPSSDQT